MTPEQKIKCTILMLAIAVGDITVTEEITEANIDDLYRENLVKQDRHWDYESEMRSSGESTGLECHEWSRNYESDAVAALMFDGSWVGWTYWHGGGKHSEPNAIEWMNKAYFLDCAEEKKLVVVRKFSKIEEKGAGLEENNVEN